MALYYEAADILSSSSFLRGSLRSRVYDSNTPLKSHPPLLYGLITDCAKWDVVLSEIIDNTGIISQEPKLTPLLAILLVHDHLLSKRGIACPANHPLRLAIERHKARIASELTKARLRRKCATLEALRLHIAAQKTSSHGGPSQPRWIRINNLKTRLKDELRTTFSTFTEYSTLGELCSAKGMKNAYLQDPNIPDLLATNAPTKELMETTAYDTGKIILQDKASCFPAHLALESEPMLFLRAARMSQGDLMDACAAPGNKTSHVVSILASKPDIAARGAGCGRMVFACERDAKRSKTLETMLDRAGAQSMVKILEKQDFLALNPREKRFSNVTHLLLDPSCSGSGIRGREDIPTLVLPRDTRNRRFENSKIEDGKGATTSNPKSSKKRKRESPPQRLFKEAEVNPLPTIQSGINNDRLQKLSSLQTRIIEHAFTFPNASLVTYSTCSVHAQENEVVVLRALNSPVGRGRCWRLLRRGEQPDGLRVWPHRGDYLGVEGTMGAAEEIWDAMTDEEREGFREACIRCKPSGVDGTMGFFVVGFVRDPATVEEQESAGPGIDSGVESGDDEWEGFSADEEG